MNLKKNLGNKIKSLRISHSLTQESLAEIINVSAKTLSQIELGNNFVSAQTLEKICTAMSVKPKSLFDFDEETEESKDMLDEIIKKLKTNKKLLLIIYKIVLALEE